MREPTDRQARTLATLAGHEGYTVAGGMDAMHLAFVHGARDWVAVRPDGDYYPLTLGARRTPPVGRELGGAGIVPGRPQGVTA